MTNVDNMSDKLRQWVEARSRFQLSDVQVQMGRELALNPKKLGDKVRRQQKASAPVPVGTWIEQQYLLRFKKAQPDQTASIEDRTKILAERKAKRQANRKGRKQAVAQPKKTPDNNS
jgi:hypothetical protein